MTQSSGNQAILALHGADSAAGCIFMTGAAHDFSYILKKKFLAQCRRRASGTIASCFSFTTYSGYQNLGAQIKKKKKCHPSLAFSSA